MPEAPIKHCSPQRLAWNVHASRVTRGLRCSAYGQLPPSRENSLMVCCGSGPNYAGIKQHTGPQTPSPGGFCKARQRMPPYLVVGCIHHECPLDQACAFLALLRYRSSPCCRAAVPDTDRHRRIYGLVAGVTLNCTRAASISLLAGCRPLAVDGYRRQPIAHCTTQQHACNKQQVVQGDCLKQMHYTEEWGSPLARAKTKQGILQALN